MIDQNELARLTTYAEGGLDADERIEVEALLEQYLQGMLDADMAGQVEQAIEADPRLAKIVERARSGGAWIDEVLAPSIRPMLDEPVSPKMEQFFDDLIAGKIPTEPENEPETAPEADTVVAFPARQAEDSAPDRTPWLIAASIAGLLALGGASVLSLQSYVGSMTEEQLALQQQVEQLTTERDDQQARLAALGDQLTALQTDLAEADRARSNAESQVAELQTQQTELEQQVANLQAGLSPEIDDLEQQRAALEQGVDRLQAEIDRLGASLADAQAAKAQADTQLATMVLADQAATARLEERGRRIAQLEERVAQQTIELADLHTRQAWLYQVAQYHEFFAEQPQRRWVAVSAGNEEALQQYLVDLGEELGLGRPVPLPSLRTGSDLTFLGGRTLVIDGEPVAQLGYRDADGRLLAICFMRNPTGEARDMILGQVGALNMADWRDSAFQYVVIGYKSKDDLGAIAEQLQGSYEL